MECPAGSSNLTEADRGAAEGVKGAVDVGPALAAHGEAVEAVQPGVGALDHPAVTARALAALHATAGDAGLDATVAALATAAPAVMNPYTTRSLFGHCCGRPRLPLRKAEVTSSTGASIRLSY